ncbi:phospholipid-binding protein MlaC [Vibrio plantisponsor]|jgi:phospholipid transport system substrate-binding protein|uniref:Phospholipid-binding protein MlaC n=1 Tax=Vibrio plantisponsor TaxID=664643 RepID=A0ABU4IKK2_9VIBR|nr:phospholipid-binding protein MlaC [Vibrio plantisponsor]MDW6018803.1 phospholipid-binding protein MlaC [Vibrio plantisponsor]NNM41561.1 phospholipid-binding protein MlaC [Vibrio plantisponsor]PNH88471.1 toluene tolerance protein [Vibrio diazotrophicus]
MLKRYVTTLWILLLSWTVNAQEIDRTDPYKMMKQVAEQSFKRLKAEQPKIQENPEYLKVIVEEELMPYINDQYAALKLLGSNLKGAKREDVGEFVTAFRAYLVTNYAQVLTQYTNQEIEFGPEPQLEDDRRISSIKVDIIDSPRPNIKLEFKLRKEKSGDWKAFDMIAEGISFLTSKQSEWNGKIRQEGILAVAKELQDLSKQPIRFESKTQ